MCPSDLSIRLAEREDIEEINALHEASVRALNARDYNGTQIEAILADIGTFDPRLIEERRYFVADAEGELVGSSGWTRAASNYGNAERPAAAERHDGSAVIRSVFVHPQWIRRGIAKRIVERAEREAAEAGVSRIEVLATLTGVPLYEHLGYRRCAARVLDTARGISLPAVLLEKTITARATLSGRQSA
ncbi:MAG: GNAT family N-acetyltransferase [Kiloniellales bacterium]|nr:GNAT family N-acetyltransferase [Kiloniellales bacterium]